MASALVWQPVAVAPCSMHVVQKAASAWQRKPSAALFAAGVTGDRLHHYARERRIVKTDEFSSVFRLRPVYRTAHFVLYIRPNALPHARLGVVAAKRLAPRAVTRNTIKRVTRESFRLSELPALDCIVRLSKPVNSKSDPATSRALKKLLRSELSQLFMSQRLPESSP